MNNDVYVVTINDDVIAVFNNQETARAYASRITNSVVQRSPFFVNN